MATIVWPRHSTGLGRRPGWVCCPTFFERRVSAYQVAVPGTVSVDGF